MRIRKNMKSSAITVIVSGLLATLFVAAPVSAAPVYTFTGTPDHMTGGYTFKQKFTVGATAIIINSLGSYDYLGDGLSESHLLGLFDNAGNLLVSTTIAAGTGSALDFGFRWQSIANTVLAAGSSFSLVSQSNLDPHNMMPGLALNPKVTSVEGGFVSGAIFNPNAIATSNDNMIWTGNFNIAENVVPEPASLALMGLGIAALAFRPKKAKVV
jgi:hypothetical protein